MSSTTAWCLWQRNRRDANKKYILLRNQSRPRSWIRRRCENVASDEWWKSFAFLLKLIAESATSDSIQKSSVRVFWTSQVRWSKWQLEFKRRQDCRRKWVENCSWSDQHCTCEFSLYCASELWRFQSWKNDAFEHWSTRLRESQVVQFDLFRSSELHLSSDEISRVPCEKREREYCNFSLDHWDRFLDENSWFHAICVRRWASLNRSSHVENKMRHTTSSNRFSNFLTFWDAQRSRRHRNVDAIFSENWLVSARKVLRKRRYRDDTKKTYR